MLERLEQIDWNRYSHAYGPANDVPEMIRGLASNDKSVRENSMYSLCSSIAHQGTVYDATVHAIPFLLELLSAPGVEDKSDLLQFLACLAAGSGYDHDVLATHSAVVEGTTLYLQLLKSTERQLRLSAPYVLSKCVERQLHVDRELRQAILAEKDPTVQASMVFGLIQFWQNKVRYKACDDGHSTIPQQAIDEQSGDETSRPGQFLRDLLVPGEPAAIRLLAALGLVEMNMAGSDANCLAVLRSTAAPGLDGFPEPPWARYPFMQRLRVALKPQPRIRWKRAGRFAPSCPRRHSLFGSL
jgi:hypothetical protein